MSPCCHRVLHLLSPFLTLSCFCPLPNPFLCNFPHFIITPPPRFFFFFFFGGGESFLALLHKAIQPRVQFDRKKKERKKMDNAARPGWGKMADIYRSYWYYTGTAFRRNAVLDTRQCSPGSETVLHCVTKLQAK